MGLAYQTKIQHPTQQGKYDTYVMYIYIVSIYFNLQSMLIIASMFLFPR